jgi:pSer/pThr/pTyr-binding forkhead associated (FHA) protein
VPRLVILEPPSEAGREYIVNGELTIGRAASCHITLDDTYISQLHARVSAREDGVTVEDLGSTNGTYLNRQRVTSPVIGSPGDRLQLGGIVMELR